MTVHKIYLVHVAETDSAFPLDKRRRAEDLLVEGKKVYYIQVFSGVSHGFAVKGNPDIEAERKSNPKIMLRFYAHLSSGFAKEECARGIVSWFSRYLK